MKFWNNYKLEYGKILKIQFNHTFNRKQYLVLFNNGKKHWTYKLKD